MDVSGKLLLVLTCLTILQVSIADVTTATEAPHEKFVACNPANATETTCPDNARCIDNATNSSFCLCQGNQTVNEHYNAVDKTSRYCMDKPAPTTTTTTTTKAPEVPSTTTTAKVIITTNPSTSSTKPSSTTAKSPAPVETTTATTQAPKAPTTTTSTAKPSPAKPTESDEVTKAPVEPSHFFSGILIPLLIVSAFIGAVFAIRKYDLIDRAYNRIRHRNTPTQHYNGLMENDFDDDPLLI